MKHKRKTRRQINAEQSVKVKLLSGKTTVVVETIDNYILEKLLPEGELACDYPELQKTAETFNCYLETINDASLRKKWRESVYKVEIFFLVNYIKHVIKTIQLSGEDYRIISDIDYICKFMRYHAGSSDNKARVLSFHIKQSAKKVKNPELYQTALEEVLASEKRKVNEFPEQEKEQVKKLSK